MVKVVSCNARTRRCRDACDFAASACGTLVGAGETRGREEEEEESEVGGDRAFFTRALCASVAVVALFFSHVPAGIFSRLRDHVIHHAALFSARNIPLSLSRATETFVNFVFPRRRSFI